MVHWQSNLIDSMTWQSCLYEILKKTYLYVKSFLVQRGEPGNVLYAAGPSGVPQRGLNISNTVLSSSCPTNGKQIQ